MTDAPAYKNIAAQLAAEIKEGRFEKELLPSESALCERFAASRITVRNALKILEDSRLVESIPGKGRRALSASERGGLKKKELKPARGLRFDIVVRGGNLPAYRLVFNQLCELASRDGVNCQTHMPGFTESEASSLMRALAEKTPDAIATLGMDSPQLTKAIEESGIPAVHVNPCDPMVKRSVGTNNFAGGFMMGEHLASRGIKKIFVLVGEGSNLANTETEFGARLNGVSCALKKSFGDACSIELLVVDNLGASLKKRLMQEVPDALFMITDTLAGQVSATLAELGLNAPDDLGVCGYDNMFNTEEKKRILADSVEQPWLAIADTAYAQLTAILSGPALPPTRVLLRPSLVLKGSVGRKSGQD